MQLKRWNMVVASTFLATVCATGIPATAASIQDKPATAQPRPAGSIKDGWITMKIHSQFIPEDALDNSDIDVDTVNGVVTLTGTVASDAGKARAVAIVKATDGVKSVNDKLRVAAATADRDAAKATKSAGRRVNDGWITSKIYADFLNENALEDSDIDVDVTAGAATLTGTVMSEAGRARAVAIAKATEGVKSVKDNLKVTVRK